MNSNDSTNPFANYMKNFPDMNNLLKNMPMVDTSQMADATKHTAEILNETNKIIAANAQEIFNKTAELVQKNADAYFNYLKSSTGSTDFEQVSNKGQELVKEVLQNSMDGSKAIMDIASESVQELMNNVKGGVEKHVKKPAHHTHHQKKM